MKNDPLVEELITPEYPDYLCYYYRDIPSFMSVLEIGLENARNFLNKNDVDWRSSRDYLYYRIEVETWLKKQFINKGGKPTRQYPIYMSLGIEKVYENDMQYKEKLILPLDIFDRYQISFTYLDSMHTKEGKKPKIFMIDEIKTMIDKYGAGYNEAQIWDDAPLLKIKENYLVTKRRNYL